MGKNHPWLQWFYNLPIHRKQLLGLFSSEVVSIIGLVGVGAVLIVIGGRSALVSQAKSELAVTEINYNIKIDQMGFGFRGQSDNLAIIAASKANKLAPSQKQQVRKILQNEVKARNIEYATLVGKNLQILANANRDRSGEFFNPQNLVSHVLRYGRQIKTSEIISWEELSKESPPSLENFPTKQKQSLLIRYTITPVRDMETREVIGALISGDIVDNKHKIVNRTNSTYGGGYSAVYLLSQQGNFDLATAALLPRDSQPSKNPSITPLPNDSLLKSAVATPGQPVAQRVKLAGRTYTMAAKTVANFAGKPIAVLVRGTPEDNLNVLLEQSLLVQILIAGLALILDVGLAVLLGRAIADPIRRLQKATQGFSQGHFQVRAEVFTNDEVGELAASFNSMASGLAAREQTINQQMHQLQETLQQLQEKQTQLVQAEKMSSLGQMVAGIAHEINNPVNFINGNLNYLQEYTQNLLLIIAKYQEEYPQPTPQIQTTIKDLELDYLREDLPKIINSLQIGTEKISEIVTSLRNFSRLDENACQAVDLHAGIDSTLMILNHKLKMQKVTIHLVKEYGNLPPIECYPSQINQVFMNLIGNAIDALGENEHNANQNPPTITIRTQMIDDEWVAISIIDNGSGIPASLTSQIFQPFFTTKPIGKGTGLGLSISYQIVVEKHSGTITCKSQPGEGTEFRIQLPCKQAIATSQSQAEFT